MFFETNALPATYVRMSSETNALTDLEERRFSAALGIDLAWASAPGTCK